MAYEYLISMILAGLIWLLLYLREKDLRKEILFGGLLYALLIIPSFFITKVLSYFIEGITWRVVPDYWNPHTLFNLGQITGGVAIEDLLFMIFIGGIATVCYETILNKKPIATNKKHHILAIIVFYLSYIIIAILGLNVIYNFIIPSLLGFITIILQRRDLIKHSIYGGSIFLIIYIIGFLIFNIMFPHALISYWNLKGLSGILILNVPIEELFYAISFGLMWTPIYEYVKGYKIK